ncbi:uncharacterized protein LOC126800609 isoform X1 [Argentina anserina]|uniref:uncharacterized protein LOC126800609 isoform X1 n=2 Tax=Potentilleae TaxID=721789 RepID=UPI0021765B40|nr:uncharacterized protein LOC126800609 isoform X1 [Potentilla anserina]XP_050383957.1 uncharacterized protein LOC126800609 isoform X1 [Potentilla anserina]
MFPNSITRVLAGNWKSSPGDKRMNKITATQTGPQSALIFALLLLCLQTGVVGKMADWGPVLIAVALFVLLTPGLLFQLPGKSRVVEFNNMQTSGVSILVHTIIYFGLITIFLIAIGVHIYTGGGD